MPESGRLCTWVAPTVWSLGLLAVVQVRSIASVKMPSERDAITLAGGIAVFTVSITAWCAVTAAIWVRAIRARPDGPASGPGTRKRKAANARR